MRKLYKDMTNDEQIESDRQDAWRDEYIETEEYENSHEMSWALRKVAQYQGHTARCPHCNSENLVDYSSSLDTGTIYLDCNDCYHRENMLYYEMIDGSVVNSNDEYDKTKTVNAHFNKELEQYPLGTMERTQFVYKPWRIQL